MKTMSRYAGIAPAPRDDEDKPKLPEKCEIPNCATLFAPASNGYPERHICGGADVFVKGRNGEVRGVCAEHYSRHMVSIGRASNQDLMGIDSRLDATLIHERWARLETERRS